MLCFITLWNSDMKMTWDSENAYEINQGTKLAAYQDHKKV